MTVQVPILLFVTKHHPGVRAAQGLLRKRITPPPKKLNVTTGNIYQLNEAKVFTLLLFVMDNIDFCRKIIRNE